MRLILTGESCDQPRHCYAVEGEALSFLVDCGYQRAYPGDETPHLPPEIIRGASYLFLSHSHENQSGALPWLFSSGFDGRVVTTTETARQLPFPLDEIHVKTAFNRDIVKCRKIPVFRHQHTVGDHAAGCESFDRLVIYTDHAG